ncbi:MAG: hypothetical protein KBT03_04655 [Bacteroidales bacterium]|nr:hypothetical protein [Candidatus Scybalousia scybalohippi]
MEALALIGLFIIAFVISLGSGFIISFILQDEEYAGFAVTTVIESMIIAIMIFKFCVLT